MMPLWTPFYGGRPRKSATTDAAGRRIEAAIGTKGRNTAVGVVGLGKAAAKMGVVVHSTAMGVVEVADVAEARLPQVVGQDTAMAEEQEKITGKVVAADRGANMMDVGTASEAVPKITVLPDHSLRQRIRALKMARSRWWRGRGERPLPR